MAWARLDLFVLSIFVLLHEQTGKGLPVIVLFAGMFFLEVVEYVMKESKK